MTPNLITVPQSSAPELWAARIKRDAELAHLANCISPADIAASRLEADRLDAIVARLEAAEVGAK